MPSSSTWPPIDDSFATNPINPEQQELQGTTKVLLDERPVPNISISARIEIASADTFSVEGFADAAQPLGGTGGPPAAQGGSVGGDPPSPASPSPGYKRAAATPHGRRWIEIERKLLDQEQFKLVVSAAIAVAFYAGSLIAASIGEIGYAALLAILCGSMWRAALRYGRGEPSEPKRRFLFFR